MNKKPYQFPKSNLSSKTQQFQQHSPSTPQNKHAKSQQKRNQTPPAKMNL
jgi:hypothetical protein